jgi:protein-L-isoaspartate(D-aspartate) O-methyltransferase
MVERQLRRRGIEDERVLAAMEAVPRERFLDPEVSDQAYADRAVPIQRGQTMSQPWIVAVMISLLELRGDERVLEVGTGSGYAAAVLSMCCAEVVTIERHPPLAARAAAILAGLGYAGVEVRSGDGMLGAPDRAPFGGAIVTAVAEGGPPAAVVEQLAEGASLICPVSGEDGEHLVRFRGSASERIVGVRFVPLVPGTAPAEGA